MLDSASFEQAVAPHRPMLVRVAARVVGESAAEDVVQNGLIEAWRVREHYRYGSLKSWLGTIIYRYALDMKRYLGVRGRTATPLSTFETPELLATTDETPETLTAPQVEAARVLAVIAKLSPKYREALQRAAAEQPYSEAGAAMGLTTDQYRHTLHRARTALVKALKRKAESERIVAWQRRNHDRRKAYLREWHAAHPGYNAARTRERALRDPERVRAYQESYYREHKEQIAARKQAWHVSHRERINAQKRERYQRLKAQKEQMYGSTQNSSAAVRVSA